MLLTKPVYHGILFKGPLLRNIFLGVKTLTRRLNGLQAINLSPSSWKLLPKSDNLHYWFDYIGPQTQEMAAKGEGETKVRIRCPYGKVGDVLWVRETLFWSGHEGCWCYQLDNDNVDVDVETTTVPILRNRDKRTIPSIHMPRVAGRLFLEITEIRLERLQNITEAEAVAEGTWDGKECYYERGGLTYIYDENHAILAFAPVTNARAAFAMKFNEINGSGTWEKNPWVWVVVFKKRPNPFHVSYQ